MTEFGKKIIGNGRVIGVYKVDGDKVTKVMSLSEEAVLDSEYELQIMTKGIKDEKKVADTLRKELWNRFGAEVVYVSLNEPKNTVTIQLIPRITEKGSPFLWIDLILAIPLILTLLGIAVIMITVIQVVTNPWFWLGVFLIIFGSVIVPKLVIPEVEKIKR
jgi:uncharacterized membrane protein